MNLVPFRSDGTKRQLILWFVESKPIAEQNKCAICGPTWKIGEALNSNGFCEYLINRDNNRPLDRPASRQTVLILDECILLEPTRSALEIMILLIIRDFGKSRSRGSLSQCSIRTFRKLVWTTPKAFRDTR
jgi:hypothetical protein